MRVTLRNGCLMLALSVAFASAGVAADSPVVAAGVDTILINPQPQPWGGASDTALVVGVGGIVPPNDTVTWATQYPQATGLGIYQTSAGSVSWIYQFHVPSGALLQRVELEACDTSATAALNFGITSGLTPGSTAADISPTATTGTAATPGCAFFSIAPTATTTIDNAARNYWIYLFWSGTGLGPTTNLHSFRVYYRLRVSPAPATATFPNDVPTNHPFFRFVEAMAASGLTGGCSAGSFCPDSPVTRGQMAVFLASALGLHFPN
jgi:hypothetical protein